MKSWITRKILSRPWEINYPIYLVFIIIYLLIYKNDKINESVKIARRRGYGREHSYIITRKSMTSYGIETMVDMLNTSSSNKMMYMINYNLSKLLCYIIKIKNFSVNDVCTMGENSLGVVVTITNSKARRYFINALVNLGADCDWENSEGYKPIHTALHSGSIDSALWLLSLYGCGKELGDPKIFWTEIDWVLKVFPNALQGAAIKQLISIASKISIPMVDEYGCGIIKNPSIVSLMEMEYIKMDLDCCPVLKDKCNRI